MSRAILILAILCVVFWLIGTFFYALGKVVHFLLVIAVALFILRLARPHRRRR